MLHDDAFIINSDTCASIALEPTYFDKTADYPVDSPDNKYLLTAQNGALGAYSQYFCAAGYGATRPVADNGTDAGRAANRRIEISMILKDDTVLDIVDNYLNIELPNTEAAAPEVSPAPSASPSPTPAA